MILQKLGLLLSLTATVLLSPDCVVAKTQSAHNYNMPTVYVSASRIPMNGLNNAGRKVVVLDADEIARRAPNTLAELLAGLPGFDSRTRGPLDVQTDLEVNGATYSQVLILVDGVRVNDPQTGHHTMNLPFAPGDLERVEVVYGAGSSIHGPDAFGAVVNLVPLKEAATRLDLSSSWGRPLDDSLRVVGRGNTATLRHGWKRNWGSVWFAAETGLSEGYRYDTDFNTDRFLLSTTLPVANGRISLLFGVRDKEFGANDFYAPYPSKEWTQAWLYNARYNGSLGSRSLTGTVSYRRHRDRFVLWVDNPDRYDNRHVNEMATVNLHTELSSGSWGSVIAGGEMGREEIDSNNLGKHEQNRGALFSECHINAGSANITAGLRVDHHQRFGWEASPSIGMRYGPAKLHWFASAGRAYRAPSFTELYYEDPGNNGNADLTAERVWSIENGLQWQTSEFVSFRSTAFLRLEDNLIDYVRIIPDGDETEIPPWNAMNLGKMRSVGINHQASMTWGRTQAQFDYSWIDKEQTLRPEYESKYVFAHPRHQLGIRLHQELTDGMSTGWHLSHKKRRQDEDYTLVNLVIKYKMSHGPLLLRVSNLTDIRYEAVAGAPMPGRWFSLETQMEL